jgi:hypothetical protein
LIHLIKGLIDFLELATPVLSPKSLNQVNQGSDKNKKPPAQRQVATN